VKKRTEPVKTAWVTHAAGDSWNSRTRERTDLDPRDFDLMKLAYGVKRELEHTVDRELATKLAMEKLAEDDEHYEKLGGLKIPKKFKLKKPKLSPVDVPKAKKIDKVKTVSEKVVERARKFMKQRRG